MIKDKYITYEQLNHFLKENSKVYSKNTILKKAEEYFEKHNLYKPRENLFPLDYWVLDMSNDDFENVSTQIPYSLDNLNNTQLENISTVYLKDGYKCFMHRYLTYYSYTEHHHDFFEVCYVWKGACLHHCEGADYSLQEGEFLIIPPKARHHIEIEHKDSIIFNLVILKDLFNTALFDVLLQNHPVSFLIRNCLLNEDMPACLRINKPKDSSDLGIRRILKMMSYEFFQNEPHHGMMSKASTCLLFGIIMASYSKNFSFGNKDYNDTVMEIMDYLNSNYRNITLCSLSLHFGYSEAHLSRLIKKYTGITFSQLLRSTRISHSIEILDTSDASFQKICDIVGYKDIGSFVRAFKKEKGIGPKEYKNRKFAG